MSRKRRAIVRKIAPDKKYNQELLSQFINKVMLDGKKRKAETIVYAALDKLGAATKLDPFEAFQKALQNVKPVMEVKSRRVGGSNYQVPMEVKPKRAVALAFRWILKHARGQKGRTMIDSLSAELEDAFNNVGSSVKTKIDTHKMAEANKAFSHFRW